MVKKALLIGINYPGTPAELWGCHNDVGMTYNYLTEMFGFKARNITLMLDDEYSEIKPTGQNIRAALTKLVESAKSGDVLFVHFSGHGLDLVPETGEEDDTGVDECIVPCDNNYIFDKDFKDIVSKVPEGCSLTFVSDSCHSGGLIDSLKEQIGESHKKKPKGSTSEVVAKEQDGENKVGVRNRSLPLETAIKMLKKQTGRDDIKVGNIRMTLFDVFREHASPTVKKFMKVIHSNLREKSGEGSLQNHYEEVHMEHNIHEDFQVEHNLCEDFQHEHIMEQRFEERLTLDDEEEDLTLEHIEELDIDFLEEKLDDEEYWKPAMEVEVKNKKEVYAGASNGELVHNAILLSGCQTSQTTDDTGFTKETSYGVFTRSIETILTVTDGKISNKDMVIKSRKLLKNDNRAQLPGLYCTDDYVNGQFIC